MIRGLMRYALIAGAAFGVIIVGAFVALTFAVHNLRTAERSDAHTELVLSTSHVLEKEVLDLETGLRGFLLTNEPQFLQPYDAAVIAYPAQARRLLELTSGDRMQQLHVRTITTAIAAYITYWGKPLIARGAANPAAIRHTIVLGGGKKRIDAIRTKFDELNARAQTLADARRSDLNGLGRLILWLGFAAVILSAVLIVLGGFLMRRAVVLPVRRLAAAIRHFGVGELSMRVTPKGVGEMGDLKRGFNAMADTLEIQREELEQQNAELAASAALLKESEQRLGRALEAAGMGAWALDPASGRMWRSAGHDRIFGHPELLAEWSFATSLAHVVPADRALFQDAFTHALETDRLAFECRIAWPDGSEHWVWIEGRVERGSDGKPVSVAGTVADVTDRVHNDERREQLEDQARHSQKMDAVGQLAGGIAHDFNNLLTAICGYSEFALTRLDGTDPKLRTDIEEIARAGERAAELTGQLLTFSRRQTLQLVVFDLNHAVSDSENLLRRLLGEHVDIICSLAPEGCPITADRGQIEQVLMNLAVNARDAMPGGGTLAIETERTELAEEEARQRELPAGDYVLLRVSDTGCGMDAATQARAFEPFFTTKPPGEGTGLGLATVFGIVGQSSGSIVLTSEVSAGTTFEILLPLTTATVPAAVPAPAAPTTVGGTERILLVEDDPNVRAFAAEILSGRGYDVTQAADGEEALSLSLQHQFDLLVTDVVMPKLSGKELAVKLRCAQPGLPVIYMSGYAYDVVGDHPNEGETFIQKPFSAHDLGTAVRAELDSL